MTTVETIQEIGKAAGSVTMALAAVWGSVSALATAVSHLPGLPARAAETLARIGVATAKFSVNKRQEGVTP